MAPVSRTKNPEKIVAASLFLLCAALIHCGCATTQTAASVASEFTLDELLGRMPARDTLETRWLASSIIRMGPDSVLEICSRMKVPGSERNAQAEYALQAAAEYVVSRGSEPERLMFVSALGKALDRPRPPRQSSFLLARLQVAGRRESVPTASRFLADDQLCEPAAQAMVVIRDGAEPAFLEALPGARRGCRITILKSLGDLRARGAVDALLKEAVADDQGVRLAALYGLANIGEARAETVLARGCVQCAARETDECLSYQVLFARRQIEGGNLGAAISIGNGMLTGPTSSGHDQFRAAALDLLVRAKGEGAVEDLLRVMADSSRQLRSAALECALQIPGEPATGRWVAASVSARPEVRAEILGMLGRRGDTGAYSAAVGALRDGYGSVRGAAVEASVRLGKGEAIAPLLSLLQQSADGGDVAAVRKALETLPADQLIPPCVESLPRLTPPACVMILDLLGKYGTAVPSKPILDMAENGQGAVRLAALRVLGTIAQVSDQPQMVEILLRAGNEQEQVLAQRSLVSLCSRTADPADRLDALVKAYASAAPSGSPMLLRTMGRIGGDSALALVGRETRSSNADVRDAAIRALADWPTMHAYDSLLAVAKGREKLNLRVIAIRGAVRVVENAPISPATAVRYHERTLAAAERVEEKRLVLGALANIHSTESLKLVIPYVGDDSLGLEAALAASKISAGKTETKDELSPSRVSLAFLESMVPPQYRARLDHSFDVVPGLNVPPEGFRPLFNGKSLDGWKGLVENPIIRAGMDAGRLAAAQTRADSIMRAHWTVTDGILLFDGKGESLCSAKDFGDFELLVDWKIGKNGDSGIYLRGSPQVQIWDPAQWPEGSGGLYNNQKNPSKPLRCADNPIGEWNTFRIRMIGERVTVYLNDVLVVDDVLLENYWDRTIPIFSNGQIELQSHNSPLYFRNIFVREIPRRGPLFSGSLLNGADLTGWTVVGGSDSSWGVADGNLFTTGEGGGWLSTVREYDNFQLDLDFRLAKGGNSGVFLRSPRQGDPAYTGMEIQVLDDDAPEYAGLQPWQYCGSLYGVVAPSVRAGKKAHEWQHFRITACGPRITVVLNGQQIIDADLIAYMDKEPSHPGLKRRSGFIGLQAHSLRVEYRHITLTELEWTEAHDGN
jgi:HEAT repeat protein